MFYILDEASEMSPTEWGWRIVDGKYIPKQTDIAPAPAKLLELIRCGCKGDCATKRCVCKKFGLDCTSMCSECRGSSCSNTGYVIDDDILD